MPQPVHWLKEGSPYRFQQGEFDDVTAYTAAESVDDSFDPYKILGLTISASAEQIRTAYLSLTRRYHPDRYTSMDLPKEVFSYIDAMSRRINAAYALVSADPENEVATISDGAAAVLRVRKAWPKLGQASNRS